MSKIRSEGPSPAVWGMAIITVALVIGAAFWLRSGHAPCAETAPTIGHAQGSSFDTPVSKQPAPPAPGTVVAAAPSTEPKPADLPAPVPPAAVESKPVEKPVEPQPEKVAEKKAEPKPAESPVTKVVEKKEEPKEEAKAPEATAPPVKAKADAAEEKTLILPFDKLAFRYWPQVKGGKDPIPAEIRKLDGRKVAIEGYMVPLDVEKGKVRSFMLSRAMLGCCFADSLGITEMVKVQRADGKPISYEQTVRVTGTLEVGEEKDADGYIESVYRIKAETVAPALFGR